MYKHIILLVISSMCGNDVIGRSWPNNFEYNNRGSDGLQYVHKQLRNWDPDRIWFPDFDERYFSTETPSTEPIGRMTPIFSRNVNECIKQCPKTSEYNPVCGTNRETYSNVGHLECARSCGVDVRVLRPLPCSLVLQESTTTMRSQTSEDEQQLCIKTCPTTPEYNPICGTNNVTYQNRGGLECARFCGVAVDVKRLSPCPKPIRNVSPADQDAIDSDQAHWANRASNSKSLTVGPDKPNAIRSQELLNEVFATDSKEADIDIRLHERT